MEKIEKDTHIEIHTPLPIYEYNIPKKTAYRAQHRTRTPHREQNCSNVFVLSEHAASVIPFLMYRRFEREKKAIKTHIAQLATQR